MNDKRLLIREKIRSEAKDLITKVVNTAIEYKTELLSLEADNKNLHIENTHLQNINKSLENKNNLLIDEINNLRNRLDNLINIMGTKNMCYNCHHNIDCGERYLCVYCQKYVCPCCNRWCKHEINGILYVENGISIEQKECLVNICKSCFKNNIYCPEHNANFSGNIEEKMEFFHKHKWRYYDFLK